VGSFGGEGRLAGTSRSSDEEDDGQLEVLERLKSPQPPHRPSRLRLAEHLAGDLREAVEVKLQCAALSHVCVRTTGELVGAGNFEAQADQVFRNLAAALASIGCTARDLVKLTVFVRDMNNLVQYRAARQRFGCRPGCGWPRPAESAARRW